MSKEAMKLALEAAYLAGWDASGEGYNAEYPFGDHAKNPEEDARWVKNRDDALREALAEQPAQTDWEAVAADQAMTIALLNVQLEGLPGVEQLPWFKDEIPAAWMYDRARYGPTDLRGQQWLPELSRLKPYTGDGRVRGLRPLYTHPIAQTWSGLPESAFAGMTLQQVSAMKYAEQVLKEKNT